MPNFPGELSITVSDPFPETGPNQSEQAIDGGWKEVFLLVEPRATVHAYTGILPVKELRLRPEWMETAFENMDVPFRVGPLMFDVDPGANDPDGSPMVARIPHPASQRGKWV